MTWFLLLGFFFLNWHRLMMVFLVGWRRIWFPRNVNRRGKICFKILIRCVQMRKNSKWMKFRNAKDQRLTTLGFSSIIDAISSIRSHFSPKTLLHLRFSNAFRSRRTSDFSWDSTGFIRYDQAKLKPFSAAQKRF